MATCLPFKDLPSSRRMAATPRKIKPGSVHENQANGLVARRQWLEGALLKLHGTVTLPSLWIELQDLLEAAYPHHSLVLGLQFTRTVGPSVMLHSRPLPLRTPEWYDRNLPVHPGLAWLQQNPGAKLVRVSDVLPLDELKAGDYYQVFMEPEGWVHGLGFFYWNSEGIEHMIGINRAEDQGDFDAEDMELAHWLHPQIGVALRRVAQLRKEAGAREVLATYLMDLPLPALSLDWNLQPFYANHAARQTLARWESDKSGDAAPKPPRRPRLPSDIRAACLALKKQITAADRTNIANPTTRTVQARVPHRTQPGWIAFIKSLPFKGDPVTKPGFWITWLEPVDDAGPTLGKWKLLSPRERDVARRIARGETNAQIAHALGRSLSTVKTHLESMFRKLGVKNRAGLLARLGRPD